MKNIKDLSRQVAKECNMPSKEVHFIIEKTFDEIANILINEGEEVRIKNFGAFKFGTIPGKKTKHPTTKEEIIIEDKKTVRLGLSTKIKKGLNGKA